MSEAPRTQPDWPDRDLAASNDCRAAVEEITIDVYADVSAATPQEATAFLVNLVAQSPEKILAVSTEMHSAFTDWRAGFNEDMVSVGPHPFAVACRAHVTRQVIVHTSATKRSSDFIAHLEQLDRLFGPQPRRQAKPVVLVEDNGPIHTSKRSLAALAARAHWLTVEWLPKYAPELNEIEPVWRDLKAHHLAHQTFKDIAALDRAVHDAVIDLNRERIPNPLAIPRISA
jgi:transposase